MIKVLKMIIIKSDSSFGMDRVKLYCKAEDGDGFYVVMSVDKGISKETLQTRFQGEFQTHFEQLNVLRYSLLFHSTAGKM